MYRPQKWADVVGQELIVRTLTNEIAHDTLVHAYLFTGTRGVGKTTTARLLAKTVNCEKRKKGDVEPCNACPSCVAITDGRSLDVMEIDAASHTGVDNVRENIIAASRVAPLAQKMKVFIIDEVHMLSTPAFNALLKTIEEPSSKVLFILATTDSDRVPETIISRCQRFDFRNVGAPESIRRLQAIAKSEGAVVDLAVLASIVRHAQGSLRDAESVLGQLLGMGKKKITAEDAAFILPQGDRVRAEEFLRCLLRHDARAAIALVDDFVNRGGDVVVFIADCIELARLQLLSDVRGAGKSEKEDLGSREATVVLLRRLLDIARDASFMEPPQLALELLVAEYAESRNHGITESLKHKSTPITKQVVVTGPVRNDISNGAGQAESQNHKITKSQNHQITDASLTLAMVHEQWKAVLTASKKHNHSLALILKVATPVAIDDRVLTLGFRYAFHADRLNDLATKAIARRILEEVFARPLDVRTTIMQAEKEVQTAVAEKPMGKQEPQTDFLSDILTTFGGKVVKKGASAL